jgi:uncharacterized protein
MQFRRRTFLSHSAGALGAPAAFGGTASALASEFGRLEIVDTHEHLLPEKERISQPVDFFTLAGHYAINDVISAGLSKENAARVRDPNVPALERWRLFEPHWQAARFTGYGQCLRIAMRDIYGVENVSRDTIERLNQAIAQRNKPGLYRDILKERARIAYAVLDQTYAADPVLPDAEFFAVAARFDRFVTARGAGGVRTLEALTGSSITTLAGLKVALEKDFERTVKLGIVAVKSALAYQREIAFEAVPEGDAARDFEAMMRGDKSAPPPYRKLEDYMFHQVMRLASAHRLPVQIHTGLQAGNAGLVRNTNPTHLTNLFSLYPDVTFDLFHIGYPYQGELSVLAKLFPNVCIDFCWAHIIALHAAQRALDEYLDTVPVNKILGFGGDYRFPELTYAHASMARRNIAAVLASRVEEGTWTEREAVDLGRMLLRDNPARLFPRKARTAG